MGPRTNSLSRRLRCVNIIASSAKAGKGKPSQNCTYSGSPLRTHLLVRIDNKSNIGWKPSELMV